MTRINSMQHLDCKHSGPNINDFYCFVTVIQSSLTYVDTVKLFALILLYIVIISWLVMYVKVIHNCEESQEQAKTHVIGRYALKCSV